MLRAASSFSQTPNPTTVKTTHPTLAPVSDARSQRTSENKSAKPHIHLHAEFQLESEIADLGDAFAGGPVHQVQFDFDAASGLDTLAEVYGYRVFRANRFADERKLKWNRLVLRFAHDAYVIAYSYGSGVIIAANARQAEVIFAELHEVLGDAPKPEAPAFYMLRHDGNDFAADAIPSLPDALGDEFIRLAYGDDAAEWMTTFAARTTQQVGGLTIIEGPPGTGKTSLVSELIRRLHTTHLFYVLPVNNDGALTSAELVSFWKGQNRRHPGQVKVVVLEDAERVLLGRRQTDRDAVAAVLNIADGLLGRMLKLHLLCSINARFDELDPAIQRPGRLMNYRRFTPVPRDRAVALAKLHSSGFVPHPEVDEFTLAEILRPSSLPQRQRQRSIGFAPANGAK